MKKFQKNFFKNIILVAQAHWREFPYEKISNNIPNLINKIKYANKFIWMKVALLCDSASQISNGGVSNRK